MTQTNLRGGEELEHFLGDPEAGGTVANFATSLHLDELEEFPSAAFEALRQWRLGQYFIPASQGGALNSFEEALGLLRVLSRRDLTLAVAQGQTFLGAIHVWLAGSQVHKLKILEIINAGGSLAFALTEKEHGSDILSSEVCAERCGDGYVLTGEKWLINNGTRAAALTVFARTEAGGGSRGFSLFLVDKSLLAESCYEHLPKIKTHGLRGADISGIRFNGCFLPADAVVGKPGAGLEIALKGLSVTRAMCAGFSLGCMDTALRVTLQFALSRSVYEEKVWMIPHARNAIVMAFADLLCCECVALLGTRTLHLMPGQFNIWSSVIKYLVPKTAEDAIGKLSVVMGARHYLRASIFEKMMRDNAIVGLFDGSSIVNLNAIALQLPHLLRLRDYSVQDSHNLGQLSKLCHLGSPLPEFDLDALRLSSGGKHDLITGLIAIASGSVSRVDRPVADPEAVALIEVCTHKTAERLRELSKVVSIHAKTNRLAGPFRSVEMLSFAEQFCKLHASAALVCLWSLWQNQEPFFASGVPVAICLHRLIEGDGGLIPDRMAELAAKHLEVLLADRRMFSIFPFTLAEACSN